VTVGEGSLLDWLSVAALAATALGAAAGALYVPEGRRRFASLAAILAFLAVDDAFGVHERVTGAIAGWLGVSGRGDALFLVPYLPLLAAAFGLLWRAAQAAGRPARTIMRLGLALLVAGVAMRLAAAFVATAGISLAAWAKTLGVAAMHDAELAAWVLLASGLASALAAARRVATA
jgi:hypothetical protein